MPLAANTLNIPLLEEKLLINQMYKMDAYPITLAKFYVWVTFKYIGISLK
jgi:hypothetical protein